MQDGRNDFCEWPDCRESDMSEHTPGPWEFARDSYGKVRHSRKACVYTSIKGDGGDCLATIAARIENWSDARLIAAAPELAEAIWQALDDMGSHGNCVCEETKQQLRAALAKAEGR